MTQAPTSTARIRLRHIRRWLAALIVLGVSATLLWVFLNRGALLQQQLNRVLSAADIEVTASGPLQLSLNAIAIEFLSARHGASGIAFDVEHLQLAFSLRGLLNGRMGEMELARLHVKIPPDWPPSTPVSTSSAPAQNAIADLLPMLHELPVQTLQIHQGMLDFFAFDSVQQLQWQLRLRSGERADVELTLAAPGRLETGYQQIGAVELGQTTVQWQQPIQLHLRSDDTLLIAAPDVDLDLSMLRSAGRMAGAELRLRELQSELPLTAFADTHPGQAVHEQLSALLPHLTARADVQVKHLYTNLLPFNLWNYQFELSLELARQELQANLLAQLINGPEQPLLITSVVLNQPLPNGAGQAAIRMPDLRLTDSLPLSAIVAPLPGDADLTSGYLDIEADLQWPQMRIDNPVETAVSGTVAVQAQLLSGFVNRTVFTGFSTGLRAELMPGWQLRTTLTGSAVLNELDAGIKFNDISTRYDFDTSTGSWTALQPQLSAFGGRVYSERIALDIRQGDSQFTLQLNDIDISRIMALSAYDSVTATGRVSGLLPVTLTDFQPSIEQGVLYSPPPGGSIRYRAPGQTGNQSLDLVYQALQQYNYEHMEAFVQYASSGELELAMRLAGVSPALNNGQRINLNLTINDNLIDLLTSLQAGRNVTELLRTAPQP